MPEVAVVVPTRDRRALLAETVARIRAQTVPVELLVVDEASADDTPAWLAHQGLRTIRHATARGPGAARNVGVAATTARWLAFCDDDDLWAPDKLERQLAVARGWSATGCAYVDRTGRVTGGQRLVDPASVAEQLRTANVVPGGGSSLLVDRALFEAVGGFAEDLDGAHDWELALRLAGRAALDYVDAPLVAYRRHPGSRSRDHARAARVRAEIRRRHDLPPFDPAPWAQGRGRAHAEAGERLRSAGAYARTGQPRQAAYALAALVSPRLVTRRLDARDLAAAPAGWVAQAEAWLGAAP